MIELGQYNTLTVLKTVDFGIYMDGGDGLEILMPAKYVPHDARVGDEIRCFVYQDSSARLLATTERPYATVGQFASLRITMVNRVGAFADWGVSKELFIPYSEQKSELVVGRRYIIYIYVDRVSGRIVGTERIGKYLDNVPPEYAPGDEVEILIWQPAQLGYKVIVNDQHTGMIYANQIFRPVHVGERTKAYVRDIREDSRIDLTLQPTGYRQVVGSVETAIMNALRTNNGFLALSDHSDPEAIAALLHCSKKNFKKAAGALYREGSIRIAPEGLYLTEDRDAE